MLAKRKQYKQKTDHLYNYLPWYRLLPNSVILGKDGQFQKTYKFRGPDLASATPYELINVMDRINNVLKRLQGGWAFFSEARRIVSQKYPDTVWPDPISFLIDTERRLYFEGGSHYESQYYFTILYLPPEEKVSKFAELFVIRNEQQEKNVYEQHYKTFLVENDRILRMLKDVLPQAEPLTAEETLTYLHDCISTKHHHIKVPETAIDIDKILADTPFLGGIEPKLGENYLRLLVVTDFPGTSTPGLLDKLNQLNFPYRWCSRYLALDKIDAQSVIESIRRKMFAKRKGTLAMIKEVISQSESQLVDNDAINKAEDADAALQEVSADLASYGYFTMTVAVWDKDPQKAEKKSLEVENVIRGLGFSVINEAENAVHAWLGCLPGVTRYNVRRPLLNSYNLAHIIPISAKWAGPTKNKHLDGPVLLYTESTGKDPFRLDLHIGDVGHTMIVGPTGAGKSVLLATLATAFRKYGQVYCFDKDASIRATTFGVGGDFYELAAEKKGDLSFQPLANIDDENEMKWAADWIYGLLRGSGEEKGVEITPEVKEMVWTALKSLANAPKKLRTISGLSFEIQDLDLRQALHPFIKEGEFGKLFDAENDNLDFGRWQAFEMATLMNTQRIVAPTLSYLFHRLEQRLDGTPTLFILDECWLMLDNPIFAAKIREWLKVLRKFNTSVVFATQSVQDIAKSSIAPAIIDSCLTKIFLPNANAQEDHMAPLYEDFGLNSTEIHIISTATPKRDYYYKSSRGSKLFNLALGQTALAYCAASSKNDQKLITDILEKHGKDKFNEVWLREKGLTDAAKWVAENDNRESYTFSDFA